MSKRTLDTFFKPLTPPPSKKPKPTTATTSTSQTTDSPNTLEPDTHESYPIPIPNLPPRLASALKTTTPAKPPKIITNHPHLDILYYQPYVPRATANELFTFLRAELPFYRVQYTIKRGELETRINTPRYTTVFGVDETARFIPRDEIESTSSTTRSAPDEPQPPPKTNDLILTTTSPTPSTPNNKYTHPPRPIPTCLHTLLHIVQTATSSKYNFILINYYASGEDSISFHSDDERFLGPEPTIASLSLGAEREFVMKHKPFPSPPGTHSNGTGARAGGKQGGGTGGLGAGGGKIPAPIKMPLTSGDMVVMRGPTQSNWLHSIPKRKGKNAENIKGRINITFRRALVPGGTNNYYTYNVGNGPVYRWDGRRQEMVLQESLDK